MTLYLCNICIDTAYYVHLWHYFIIQRGKKITLKKHKGSCNQAVSSHHTEGAVHESINMYALRLVTPKLLSYSVTGSALMYIMCKTMQTFIHFVQVMQDCSCRRHIIS